jgi:hypothetical protein
VSRERANLLELVCWPALDRPIRKFAVNDLLGGWLAAEVLVRREDQLIRRGVRDSGTETIDQGISLLLVAPGSLHDRADYSDELLAFHPPILMAAEADRRASSPVDASDPVQQR